jgi:putative ABC transport system substrate-binding protein
MKRRAVLRAIGALSVAGISPANAQPARSYRLGWVSIEQAGTPSPSLDALRDGLRELGYVEGRDYTITAWWGGGSSATLDAMVGDIVRAQPDVIVSQGGLALAPLIRAGVTIPIVFGYSGDPVDGKVVQSFARPGGTMTGISYFTLEIVGKRLELLREILPRLKRVAFLANPQHPGEQKEYAAAKATATKLGMTVHYFPVRSEADLEKAFADMVRRRDEAIVAFADGFTIGFAERIAAFSIEKRIPAVDGWAIFARRGNLAIYGPVLEDCYRRMASYVDRIRKGANPGDLPVELPTKLELVVNLRTAKAIGLTIPQTVLARADEVIQ